MKHKTWFRLIIKAIGVLLIGVSLGDFLTYLYYVVQSIAYGDSWFSYGGGATGGSTLTFEGAFWMSIAMLPSIVPIALGLYLLFGGNWLVDKIIPSNRSYCPNCGYPLTDGRSARCPECGVAITEDAPNGGDGDDEMKK